MAMKSSTKALLWVALVFVIGSLFGAAVVRLSLSSRLVAEDQTNVQREFPPEQNPGVSDLPGDSPRSGAVRRPPARPPVRGQALQEMLRQLNMNPEQREKARQILERARREYSAVEQRRTTAQRRIRRRALMELREILDPEQRRQMRRFFQQLNQNSR